MNYFKKLLEPVALQKLLQSLAALDAIVSPEWEDRYYSFQPNWSETTKMAGIRNGCGDEVFFLFTEAGCYIKGYAHEYWDPNEAAQSHYAKVPKEFDEGVEEPAFSPDDVSFCFWYLLKEGKWESSAEIQNFDGLFLLEGLDGDPTAYQKYAEQYYEVDFDLAVIAKIYQHEPISDEILHQLNDGAVREEIDSELEEIGYPDFGQLKHT